jgi:hypothetical protein
MLNPPVSKLSEIEGKETEAKKVLPPAMEIRVPVASET